MNELTNIVTAVGNYNNVSTSITSNTSVVNLVSSLTITKEADKQNWASGALTYTIKISNLTDTPYLNPVLTDEIDTTKVDFVTGSVMLNDVELGQDKYSFNNNTLTINLEQVNAQTTDTITFRVTKKA